MNKILVTGGHGLIGHKVVNKLQKHCDVSVIDNHTNYGFIPAEEIQYLMSERLGLLGPHCHYNINIADQLAVDSVMSKEQPEILIHMASFPRQKAVNVDPANAADVMIRGLINLLESCKKINLKRFVYISSSMVYGDFENYVTESSVCKPQGQYAIMKLAGEWLVQDYARKFGWEYVIIRPSAVYGPLDVEDRVVSKFIINAMRNGVLKVNGINETLDFTYVDDAADGIIAAARNTNAANKVFNITKSHSVSLLSAAEMILKIVGSGTIQIAQKDRDFPSRGALDITLATSLLDYRPQVDVEQGFREYYAWLSHSPYWQNRLQK
jgi:nucleoside-diphosphate-sugar epimerase